MSLLLCACGSNFKCHVASFNSHHNSFRAFSLKYVIHFVGPSPFLFFRQDLLTLCCFMWYVGLFPMQSNMHSSSSGYFNIAFHKQNNFLYIWSFQFGVITFRSRSFHLNPIFFMSSLNHFFSLNIGKINPRIKVRNKPRNCS